MVLFKVCKIINGSRFIIDLLLMYSDGSQGLKEMIGALLKRIGIVDLIYSDTKIHQKHMYYIFHPIYYAAVFLPETINHYFDFRMRSG